jgi:F-type H+-transporting ATPase subunit b
MKRLALMAMVFLLFARVPARAQESEAQKVKESTGVTEHGSSEMIWGWANFLLLAGGLGYVIKKNAGPYFARRSQEIRKGMVEAEAARAESEAKVAAVDRRLANLGAEIETLRSNAQKEAEAEAERVQREAAAEMTKIQGHLAEEIASASKAARLELRRYAAELALGLASQKIAARLSPETQARLVRTFVSAMAQATTGGQGD